ncbi:MAG: glutamate racemase [Clostridia bacterium]
MDKHLPIGIFDSGVGGLTVLGRAVELLPEENFIYYADTAHFPYGDKSHAEVREHVFSAVSEMAEKGVKALVVACNTATAAAINDLRARYDFPVFGIEPALKPAVEDEHSGTIAVIATRLTLREEKFQRLLERYREKGEIINVPAAGLADLVEQGHYADDTGRAFLRRLFDGVTPDTIVLGCTHYLFTEPLLREMFPDARIIDGGEGLVRNLLRVLEESGMKNSGGGKVEVMASGGDFQPRFDAFFSDIRSILAGLPHKMEQEHR